MGRGRTRMNADVICNLQSGALWANLQFLGSLEVALALPRCHHLVELALLGLDEV